MASLSPTIEIEASAIAAAHVVFGELRFDPDAAPYLSAYDGCKRIGFVVPLADETLAFDADEVLVKALPPGEWRQAFRALCVAHLMREGGRC